MSVDWCRTGKVKLQYCGVAGAIATVLALSTTVPAAAQTLQETLELTYRMNPTLKAQRAGLEATNELLPQARAGILPTVNAQVTYDATASSSFDPGSNGATGGGAGAPDPAADIFSAFSGNGSDATTSAGVEAQQPIFQGFRTRNSLREAGARIRAAEAELVATEQQILSQAVAAYFGVVTSEESVRASEASLRALDQQLAAAKARFDAGQGTMTDTAQAEARYAGADAELIRARSDLAAAREQFRRIVGQLPQTLPSEPPLPILPATLDEVMAHAMEWNPDLMVARARLDAAGHNVKVAKGFLSPSVTANARYRYVEGQFIDGDESQNFTVGAQINIPIFQGGSTYSAIRQASASERAEHFALQATERAVLEQVQTAWERVISARAAFEASKATINANEIALRGLVLESQVGQRTTLDVLNGEQELLTARLANYQARERYYLAAYGLLQVMGRLTAETLGVLDQSSAAEREFMSRTANRYTSDLFDRR